MTGEISLLTGSKMGYYTIYSLYIEGSEEDEQKCRDDIRTELDSYIGNELISSGSVEAKWYDWQKDMEKIAKQNPNVIICLSGNGESQDDIWECRWKGDKSEYHEVVMPPFTEIKLKDE